MDFYTRSHNEVIEIQNNNINQPILDRKIKMFSVYSGRGDDRKRIYKHQLTTQKKSGEFWIESNDKYFIHK
jgi:hypothetical protein